MAKHVFLSGHGGWKPGQGYTTVPRGCRIHFYTHFAKNLITGMEHKILDGSYNTIDHTVEEYKSCPNLRLSHQEDSWTQKSQAKLATRGDPNCILLPSPPTGFSLAELFQEWNDSQLPGVEFHWLACQTLGLKQVGGRQFGLNAGDFSHASGSPGRYRIKDVGGKFTWI
ncbi:MAG TPA: hypothetical protein DEH78_10545 [Solibacterales bacterium]|nr:hypothetical protein [Bryobacterales bacterium]